MDDLLNELEQYGLQNDSVQTERPKRMLNITRDTGEFLSVMLQAINAQRVLEIGTSNGYSTLWLARAVRKNGGTVTTVEMSDYKVSLAAQNFARAGMSAHITQVRGDAGLMLKAAVAASVDAIFLDSERKEYLGWWPDLKRVLRVGGLLIVDNATSHAGEMAEFATRVAGDAEFETCTVPVGNGEFLAVKTHRQPR